VQGKRYTGPPLHDVGAKKLSWNVVGTGLLLGAEPAYVLRETVTSGSTLKLECGRYAKAGANKPATGEGAIFVVHLSLNPERRLSVEGTTTRFIFRRLGDVLVG
jgi:hypothetical protein